MRARSIGQLRAQPREDLADVLHVDSLAGVVGQAALEKTALGHRGLLARVGWVGQPVAVHDDEPVAIGQGLEAGLRVIERGRFGAGGVSGEHQHDRRRPRRKIGRRVHQIATLDLVGPERANRLRIGQRLRERRDAAAGLLRAGRTRQANGGLAAQAEAEPRRCRRRRRGPSPERSPSPTVARPHGRRHRRRAAVPGAPRARNERVVSRCGAQLSLMLYQFSVSSVRAARDFEEGRRARCAAGVYPRLARIGILHQSLEAGGRPRDCPGRTADDGGRRGDRPADEPVIRARSAARR